MFWTYPMLFEVWFILTIKKLIRFRKILTLLWSKSMVSLLYDRDLRHERRSWYPPKVHIQTNLQLSPADFFKYVLLFSWHHRLDCIPTSYIMQSHKKSRIKTKDVKELSFFINLRASICVLYVKFFVQFFDLII